MTLTILIFVIVYYPQNNRSDLLMSRKDTGGLTDLFSLLKTEPHNDFTSCCQVYAFGD